MPLRRVEDQTYGIAKARSDVALFRQLFINARDPDLDIWVLGLDSFETLAGCENGDNLDRGRCKSPVREHRDCGE